jgi:hypothetical protein
MLERAARVFFWTRNFPIPFRILHRQSTGAGSEKSPRFCCMTRDKGEGTATISPAGTGPLKLLHLVVRKSAAGVT